MPREGLLFQFTDAIVRQAGESIVRGLRTIDRGEPDIDRFRTEHRAYIKALEQAGLRVEVLPALEAFPDSVFIEDAALCLPEGTVILRPGAPSRRGETRDLSEKLCELGHRTHGIGPGGFVDGGDILETDSVILVGLSARTNLAGFNLLENLLGSWGYSVQAVQTPARVLHFKSDCCLLDSETILATSRLSRAECFASFRVLTVPQGEEAAANSIRVNDTVLIPAGFPATADLLTRSNFTVVEVPGSQAALLDGGLSCMSLRFRKAC